MLLTISLSMIWPMSCRLTRRRILEDDLHAQRSGPSRPGQPVDRLAVETISPAGIGQPEAAPAEWSCRADSPTSPASRARRALNRGRRRRPVRASRLQEAAVRSMKQTRTPFLEDVPLPSGSGCVPPAGSEREAAA